MHSDIHFRPCCIRSPVFSPVLRDYRRFATVLGPMKVRNREYRAVWREGRNVVVINQPLLPHQFTLLRLKNHRETARAIQTMVVRGAGTIGATAAYGLAQAYSEGVDIDRAYRTLLETRPTAADLKHALDRVRRRATSVKEAVAEAEAIADEYVDRAKRIAKIGLPLIKNGTRVLTHCNARLAGTGRTGGARLRRFIWRIAGDGRYSCGWMRRARATKGRT